MVSDRADAFGLCYIRLMISSSGYDLPLMNGRNAVAMVLGLRIGHGWIGRWSRRLGGSSKRANSFFLDQGGSATSRSSRIKEVVGWCWRAGRHAHLLTATPETAGLPPSLGLAAAGR